MTVRREDLHLPIRLSVYECFATLLDHAANRINLCELFTQVSHGVEDQQNVAIHAYTIITKLATAHGSEVLGVVHKLPAHIMKGVKDRLREAKGRLICCHLSWWTAVWENTDWCWSVNCGVRCAAGADATTNTNSTEGSAAATAAEKAKDVLRAAVRAIAAIQKIPDIETVAQWGEFHQRVMKTALLAQMTAELQQ
jgi:hypothetical protein